MKKLISIAVILVTVFALMIPAFASADQFGGYDMWVNCADGKTLNVREAPSTSARRITRLECGTKVHVDYDAGNGWVAISDYHYSGYVQKKFLVAQKPGKFEITERDDNFVAMNGKTDRSVGLRVKPNKTSGAIRRLNAGDTLQVIARGKTWSKVMDPQTGRTGYVANDYIQKI